MTASKAPAIAPSEASWPVKNRCQRSRGGARLPALAAGSTDNGAPGLRAHYHPNYCGAFVLDPDGHNVEAVCHTPA
jgi:hypothetical protein